MIYSLQRRPRLPNLDHETRRKPSRTTGLGAGLKTRGPQIEAVRDGKEQSNAARIMAKIDRLESASSSPIAGPDGI